MRTGIFIFVIALIANSAQALEVGDRALDFKLPGHNGDRISLSKYPGYVVLVNFWATWCSPCQKELPELQKLQTQLNDKGFTIIGVNLDKSRNNANKFIEKFKLSFPNGYDPESKIVAAYKGKAMPTSYLIGRDGKVHNIFLGYTSGKLVKMKKAIMAALSTR